MYVEKFLVDARLYELKYTINNQKLVPLIFGHAINRVPTLLLTKNPGLSRAP